LLSSAFLLYRIVAKPGNIHVKAGETSIVQVLPDGSKVTLAKGAEIDYPERFTTTGRNITLKGKAYFEVTHDASRPFRVSCNAAIIDVLGTSFNVVTGTGQTEVDLTSGKVSVYLASKPESGVLLASGEKAIVSPGDNQIKKSSSKDLNYMAWKTGDLIFTDATLRYIVKTLNDYYGSSIQLSCPELAGCRLTASFSNQSEDAVIRVIAASLNLSAVKRQGVTILEGEGCR
jgi:ferric-dicitrate binding protein FerR (iron transport regulator)